MDTVDPLDIHSQDRARIEAKDRACTAEYIEVDDLKWFMSHKRGRRMVARLLDRAGVWRISFNTNAMTMAFNEGMRNEGLRLLSQITAHCPNRYIEMLEESKK